MALYNPVTDAFTYYTPVEPEKIELDFPLFNKPLDISSWASGVTPDGIVIAKPNTPEAQRETDNFLLSFENTHYEGSNDSDSLSPSGSSAKVNLDENKKKAMNFFISKGLKPHHAAGIVGNLIVESAGLDEKAVNPTSGAYGLAQWLGDRKKKLFSKFGKNPTFDQLLEFIWEELNSSEKHAYERLLLSSNVETATNSFMAHFERPSNSEMANSIKKRIYYSKSLLS